jgi:hypothetical protein
MNDEADAPRDTARRNFISTAGTAGTAMVRAPARSSLLFSRSGCRALLREQRVAVSTPQFHRTPRHGVDCVPAELQMTRETLNRVNELILRQFCASFRAEWATNITLRWENAIKSWEFGVGA